MKFKSKGFTPLENCADFVGDKDRFQTLRSFSVTKKSLTGFTLIELLVVIAIIGILAAVVLVSLNTSRQRSRDAKRLADIKQIANALELFFNEHNQYPYDDGAGTPDMDDSIGGLGGSPFNTYLAAWPTAPTPAETGCTAAENTYTYTSPSATTYAIAFCLGATTGSIAVPPNVHTATQTGIQ